MSEQQTEYETDAKPTPGPWTNKYAGNLESGEETVGVKTTGEHYGCVADTSMARPKKENIANARLIAAAGTAAQEAREMGYDPVAAVEALPKLLEALEGAKECIRKQYSQVRAVPPTDSLAYLKAKNALASAEAPGHVG